MELMGLLKVNKLSDNEAKELYENLKEIMEMCDELDEEGRLWDRRLAAPDRLGRITVTHR